jgi:hypothetical protein
VEERAVWLFDFRLLSSSVPEAVSGSKQCEQHGQQTVVLESTIKRTEFETENMLIYPTMLQVFLQNSD